MSLAFLAATALAAALAAATTHILALGSALDFAAVWRQLLKRATAFFLQCWLVSTIHTAWTVAELCLVLPAPARRLEVGHRLVRLTPAPAN